MTPEEFKKLRRDCGKSQAEIASKLSVATETVCRWETGKAKIPWRKEAAIREVLK